MPQSFNGAFAEEASVDTKQKQEEARERGTSRQIKGEGERGIRRNIRVEKADNAIEDHYIYIDIHVLLSVSLAGPRASAAFCRVYLPYESQCALCDQANGLRHGPGQRG